ncbi:MAG: gas vesicle protein GvpD [Candidatus Undinarchaeales archaeon]|jgi:circadian clock protein KaiC|nr:gas vesicle protein GvpD [Candidatus Undinarchaeales archaeon]MDP7493193.1 gas vesicle protein GvpD [Candidatus Undinarchaeales archaeon]
MKRCNTGIKNLDAMVGGGFPCGSIIGIAGPPGTGKTNLSLQFLMEGAKKGEKGYYITLQEPVSNLEKAYASMSWGKEFETLRKKGKIVLKHLPYADFEGNLDAIVDEVLADTKAHRIVIDSLDGLIEFMKERKRGVRAVLDPLFVRLRRDDLTTVVVLEGSGENGPSSVEKFLVDGVVSLDLLSWGELERRVFIPKMRWTAQYESSVGYKITNKGIEVDKPE